MDEVRTRGDDRVRVRGYDGIRALAVSAVVAAHLELFADLKGTRLAPMLDGGAGVSAFFVLSGFLITMLMIRETDKTGRVHITGFFVRRFLRIVPLYAVLIASVIVVVQLGQPVADLRTLVAASTYTSNFLPVSWFSIVLNHTWSLAVEEHFYLIWPFVFQYLYLRRRKLLLAVSGASILCSYLFFLWIDGYWRLRGLFHFDRWTMVAGSEILFGCIVALLICGQRRQEVAVAAVRSPLAIGLGAVLYANTVLYVLPPHLDGYLRAAGVAVIVGWLYLNQDHIVCDVLEWLPLRFVGMISYGVYLWQGFFLGSEPQRGIGQSWPPSTPVGMVCLVAISPASYFLFERPIMRRGRQLLRARVLPFGTPAK